jgi:hypothetical protein
MKSSMSSATLMVLCASMPLSCGGSTAPSNQVDASSETGGQAGARGTGGTAGSGGMGGTAGAGGTMGSGGGNATGGAAGNPEAGACNPPCGQARICCAGQCVNPANDPTSCGGCGVHCTGSTSYCGGACMAPPCERDAASCAGGATCCGTECCAQGQLCCDPQGPIDRSPRCYMPTTDAPTCPRGCAPLCISDRNLKRDIEPVDAFAVLEAVGKLSVSTWSYRSDPEGVRHMGPMAQDFKAAFGLGDTDRAYHQVDANGVTLAALQALYQLSLDQSGRIERLERDNRALQSMVNALQRRPAGD